VISIDLDGQAAERFVGFAEAQRDSLSVASEVPRSSASVSRKVEGERPATTTDNKKLSIVLSKDMHRRAKLQALKEDVTLKHLVLSLLEKHLDEQNTQ